MELKLVVTCNHHQSIRRSHDVTAAAEVVGTLCLQERCDRTAEADLKWALGSLVVEVVVEVFLGCHQGCNSVPILLERKAVQAMAIVLAGRILLHRMRFHRTDFRLALLAFVVRSAAVVVVAVVFGQDNHCCSSQVSLAEALAVDQEVHNLLAVAGGRVRR